MLEEAEYNPIEMKFLIEGFTKGFDLGYQGPQKRRNTSKNIPFSVGNKEILWQKILKEVKNKRFAGPFKEIPFEYYVQSLVGVVPKAESDTHLIFYLSFDFNENEKSVNHYTPKEKCSVKCKDLDHAVQASLTLLRQLDEQGQGQNQGQIWYGKTDIKSAFRLIPLRPGVFWLLIIMAHHPVMNEKCYFVDKCLPFRHSISCAVFQHFSDKLAHLLRFKLTVKMKILAAPTTNYLDDFLFASLVRKVCDVTIQAFSTM